MVDKSNYDIKNLIEQLKSYCAIQERCSNDIVTKMKSWRITNKNQNKILEILIQEDFINDKRYSKSFCRGKFRIKKWGKIKIVNELKRKNINPTTIISSLNEISDMDYSKELDTQFNKKKQSINTLNYYEKKKKIANYLIGKGYESNLVWEKLRELKE
ncbi:MAG: regulatory protein RecX [Flavobacteriales bacterium]|jgi:regulatory protein|nr:regulatory protein RecX [Flavobacteriales bacterium]|tara:strand:+ start:607 stop:1080 length:474 start_codon:yes stop_codon:yes gene_type:complete